MKTKTKQALATMNVFSWIVFIGCCMQTGALLFTFFMSLFTNPLAAKNLYLGLNLSDLYASSTTYYVLMVSALILQYTLRAYLTYLVIRIFLKINFVHPFSPEIAAIIAKISYIAFGTGILIVLIKEYSKWLMEKGILLNNLQEYLEGAAEFILMAAILYVVAQVFNRGIELQTENELTI